jgi:hypothetical protein
LWLLSFQQKWVPETEKKFIGSRTRSARKPDNLTAICKPIV